jgi:glycosyltransferase involved in cell wall biosynthesis
LKVLIINTFGKGGGAAIAATRLKLALARHGVDVKMAVLMDESNESFLFTGKSFFRKWYAKMVFALERLQVWFLVRDKKRHLFKYSTGKYGLDISTHPAILEADILHLHWVNFSLLSIGQIAALAKIKPVVWTLHDMWAFTGGCHYALGCKYYQTNCYSCFYLKDGSRAAIDIQDSKSKAWEDASIQLVTCSNWLRECAVKSSLFHNRDVSVIGNAINLEIFKGKLKEPLRLKHKLPSEKFYILFGSMDHSDERKGFHYLVEALKLVRNQMDNLCLLTFGKPMQGVDSISFGTIDDEQVMVDLYNLADIFVLPSIQDNLPNTVMEAMACEVPVVAFKSGGVTDMIIHQTNGYLAENESPQQLADGIMYFMNEEIRSRAAFAARNTIEDKFAEEKIAKEHITLYQYMLNGK